jgi:hypothetical protein
MLHLLVVAEGKMLVRDHQADFPLLGLAPHPATESTEQGEVFDQYRTESPR